MKPARQPFPKGHEQLVAAGYVYLGAGKCKHDECGYEILWYRTPNGMKMPIDRESKLPHWQVCIAAENFRKKNRKPEAQGSLF